MDGDQLQQKLQDAVTTMLNKIEKEKMRPIQYKTHLKIAECYNSKSMSSREVEACANNCSVPIQNIQRVVENELNNFQNRLQRCGKTCEDDVQTKFYGKDMDSNGEAAMQKMYLNCMSSCVEKSLDMLKPIQVKLEKEIDSIGKGY